MNIKSHIPNLFTLANLFSGTIAAMHAVLGHYELTAIFVVIGIFFDFLDGFIARLLGVSGELGKQLDSLADVVTSGLVPGLLMFLLIKNNVINGSNVEMKIAFGQFEPDFGYLPYIAFLLTIAAGYRLAKFNLDEDQQSYFKGLPTPANALLILSLPLIMEFQNNDTINANILNPWFLVGLTLASCYLLNSNIKLFALKFKDWSFKNNAARYVFLILSIVLLILLHFAAIPLVIVLYILMSVFDGGFKKEK